MGLPEDRVRTFMSSPSPSRPGPRWLHSEQGVPVGSCGGRFARGVGDRLSSTVSVVCTGCSSSPSSSSSSLGDRSPMSTSLSLPAPSSSLDDSSSSSSSASGSPAPSSAPSSSLLLLPSSPSLSNPSASRMRRAHCATVSPCTEFTAAGWSRWSLQNKPPVRSTWRCGSSWHPLATAHGRW